jgi:hypothetical protein
LGEIKNHNNNIGLREFHIIESLGFTIEILVLEQVCLHWSCKHFGRKNPCNKSADLHPRQSNLLHRNIFQRSTKIGWRSAEKGTFFQHASASIAPTISMGFTLSGTDVMIFKIFSPKNSAKKLAFFDSKQS